MPEALTIHLHAKQTIALETDATEVLYGGAAGGGKSFLMRAALVIWASAIPGLQVYLFRRVRPDLIKNHMEGPKGLRAMLSGWEQAGFVKIVEDEIRFPFNGSKIYLCHCEHEKDVYRYQGAEMHVLALDEVTHFTEAMYRFLRGRVRMVGVNLPSQYEDKFPRILCSANPGNIGHQWVKATFVDYAAPLVVTQTPSQDGGMKRQYIPARMADNPALLLDDPNYGERLKGLGSEALVRAMEEGDWSVIEGAFFDNWSSERHVIKPFAIPEHWTRIRSFDWGSAKPFSCGWSAIADGTAGGIPRGAMVRYREWYGCVPGKPNTGLKLTADAVAFGILERQPPGEKIAMAVADPSIFQENGGPSIASMMSRATQGKITWIAADNSRQAGWQQCRARLDGEDGRPLFYVFDTCRDFIRTVPALQHDDLKPEDLDSDMEDHPGDDWRYGCMARRLTFGLAKKAVNDPYRTQRSSSNTSWMAA